MKPRKDGGAAEDPSPGRILQTSKKRLGAAGLEPAQLAGWRPQLRPFMMVCPLSPEFVLFCFPFLSGLFRPILSIRG